MKQEIKEIKESTTVVTYCDICNKEKHTRVCKMCNRDICHDCGAEYDSDYLTRGSYSSDYPDFVCYECWTKGDDIIEKIISLREEFERNETQLFVSWTNKCKE
jgi:uncharacterized metal-binding protein